LIEKETLRLRLSNYASQYRFHHESIIGMQAHLSAIHNDKSCRGISAIRQSYFVE
jgi:hypothetical protein